MDDVFCFPDKPSPMAMAAGPPVVDGGNVESFIEDHKTRADNDPSAPPFDDLRNYAYEGGGSTAGSLSSLGSGKTTRQHYSAGFIFVPTIFVTKGKFTFSQAHSHTLTIATRRHKYFRGLDRILSVPGVLVSFLELRFLGKMALLAYGRAPSATQKALSKSKGPFLQENECF